ncbi:TadE/TadG family type IV pilus assembly protein [Litoreibacter halocynthiae]|uniref:TadE/TadG family type IV pilus assembly protein n=1 Tax=Litoreibacter halocynthiae TaxID=1242689 RepID=UPI002491AD18|nr:TadE/TadG family type IV pilus assembly protein [Litoreibacter halocynthiae]
MDKTNATLRKLTDKFLAEDGTATIEALLWIPIYGLLLTFIADVSMVFHNQAQVMRIIQDGNRQLSVGRLKTTEQTEDFIAAALAGFSDNASVSTNLSSTGVINTSVMVPTEDLDSVGSWARLAEINLVVSAQHLIEF